MPIYEPISYREPLQMQLRWATQCFKCFLEARASQAGETNKTCPKSELFLVLHMQNRCGPWTVALHALPTKSLNACPHAVPKAQPRPTSRQSEAEKTVFLMFFWTNCSSFQPMFRATSLSFSCLDQWLCEQPASSSPCTATVNSQRTHLRKCY